MVEYYLCDIGKSVLMWTMVSLVSFGCEQTLQESPPVKSILIGAPSSINDQAPELRATYQASLLTRFYGLSSWMVISPCEFDHTLTGRLRETELARLGLRFFLSNSLSVDADNNVYIRVTLTDAWTERTVWTQQFSGQGLETSRFAETVAEAVHDILGDP